LVDTERFLLSYQQDDETGVPAGQVNFFSASHESKNAVRSTTAKLGSFAKFRTRDPLATVREMAERVWAEKGVALGPKPVSDRCNALDSSFANHLDPHDG
jgi:hypothetical protein